MQARQAQKNLKQLVDTATPIFEHDHIALLHCGNNADTEKIKSIITQTQRAVDIWFGDQPRDYTSRLLIFSPDEPLGKQLLREMRSSSLVAGNTEARTHTLLITGHPSQKQFWTTLRHELVHDAMLRHFDSVEQLPPFWITEGFATVFEVPAFADGKPAINLQRLERLKAICKVGTLDFAALLSMASNERESSDTYAKAWGLTFFLLRQHSSQMRQYLQTYQQKVMHSLQDHMDTFNATFTHDQSQTQLADHISRWVLLQTMP